MEKDNKLLFSVSGVLVVGFLVTSTASFWMSRESLRFEVKNSTLPLTSDNVYSEVQRDLLRPVFLSSLMASNTFFRDWALGGERDPLEATKYLKEIQERHGAFTAFYVSEDTRTYYQADGVLKKVDQGEDRDAWYFRVRDMGDEYEVNLDPDMANKDAMTIFVNCPSPVE